MADPKQSAAYIAIHTEENETAEGKDMRYTSALSASDFSQQGELSKSAHL